MLAIRNLKTALLEVHALEVPRGECIALMGPSGAGKSLLLRAIADLDPNRGEVSLDGAMREAMPATAWRSRVGLVPAESGWWADTVGEHMPASEFAGALLAELGMPKAAFDWQVARLSTGERQRLALARALCLAPAALLLDEPTGALDATATAKVEALLAARLEAGTALLLVTHDAAQARRLARRTLQMRDGRLIDGGAQAV